MNLLLEAFECKKDDKELSMYIDDFLSEFCSKYQEELLDKDEIKNRYLHMFKESYCRFRESCNNGDKSSFRYKEEAEMYDIISALGHEDNPDKGDVDMKMLYSLFWVLRYDSISPKVYNKDFIAMISKQCILDKIDENQLQG